MNSLPTSVIDSRFDAMTASENILNNLTGIDTAVDDYYLLPNKEKNHIDNEVYEYARNIAAEISNLPDSTWLHLQYDASIKTRHIQSIEKALTVSGDGETQQCYIPRKLIHEVIPHIYCNGTVTVNLLTDVFSIAMPVAYVTVTAVSQG